MISAFQSSSSAAVRGSQPQTMRSTKKCSCVSVGPIAATSIGPVTLGMVVTARVWPAGGRAAGSVRPWRTSPSSEPSTATGRAGCARRWRRRGIDVLYVMSPANILYLSGFESIWYPPRAPLGVVLRQDDERLTFLDYERHETLVAMTAHYDDAVFFDYTDAVETVVGAFRANGWTRRHGRHRALHQEPRRAAASSAWPAPWPRPGRRSSPATGSSTGCAS